MLLIILMVKKLLEHFMKKNCKKTNQEKFRIEKLIMKKGDKLCVKWKGYDNSFSSWIDKKDAKNNNESIKIVDKNDLIKISQYFPKPYEPFGGDINVKVDLSN